MKIITIKKDWFIAAILVFGIFAAAYGEYQNETVEAFMPTTKKTIILDAGHGGWDPGKVSAIGTLEKDINLSIVHQLQKYLEQGGATVLLTRNDDTALEKSKSGDLNGRRLIANESNGDIMVSIHQNSFPMKNTSGAQVFYHNNSEKGKELAGFIQDQLVTFVDPENKRIIKANTDYYILKNTTIPAIIVECGFISNPNEEQKLLQKDYQEKIAWAIYKGIIDYFDKDKIESTDN